MTRSIITPELADRIVAGIRAGRYVEDICRDEGMPCSDTVSRWIQEDRDGFGARCREARAIGPGRASQVRYSPEIVEAFLAELMAGRNLVDVCTDPDMPSATTINTWVATDRDGFAARYRAAREVGRLRKAQVAYSPEVIERLADGLMDGWTLRDVCAEPDMPSTSAVHTWLKADRDGFRAIYKEAREIGCYAIADDVLKLVDERSNDWILWRDEDGKLHRMLDPERNKRTEMQVRERWRVMSRLAPQQFGEPARAVARSEDASAYERDLAEMRALVNGRSRALPGEDTPPDEE
jgi:hypothetical protein